MAPSSAAPDDPGSGGALARNALGFVDMLVVSVAGTAPAYSLTSTTASLVAAVALAGPAALIVALAPMFGIALAFLYLNQWRSDAGATYAWVGRSISPDLGFLSGWALMTSNAMFSVFVSVVLGATTLALLAQWRWIAPALAASAGLATLVGLAWFAVVLLPMFAGISLVARFQRALMLFEMAAVVAVLVGAAVHARARGGPAHPFHWSWLSPASFHDGAAFMNGMLVAAFYYWGWDISANLSEESRDRHAAPGLGAAWGMLGIFVLFVAGTCVFQYVLPDAVIQRNGATLLSALADYALPRPWGGIAVLAVVVSALGTLETSLLQASRTLYSMGRDHVLAPRLSAVSARLGTPVNATALIGAVTVALFLLARFSASVNGFVTSMINAISLQVVFYYGLAGLACAWVYRDALSPRRPGELLLKGVWPLLSALFLLAVGAFTVATANHHDVAIGLGALASGLIPLALSRGVWRSRFYRAPRERAERRGGEVVFVGGAEG